MKYRIFGKTNLKVSEIGYGTWQIANDPHMWVGATKEESKKSLAKYLELGGNFIDTAWVYGYSEEKPERHPSEELVGECIKESNNRERVVIATKVAPANWHWPAWKTDKLSDCFPSEHIKKQVDDSLKSLQVDFIDLVQFHVWNDSWSDEQEWKDTIQEIIKSGKVKNWGISINDYQPSNCLKTLDTGLISTVQFIYNVFHQKPVEKLLPYAKEHNIGLIARVPLDEGGLSGKIDSNTTFQEGDFRSSYFSSDRLLELEERIEELSCLLSEEIQSVSELALRFILTHPEISCVIPGMRKIKHVIDNTAVSDKGSLSSTLMEELKKHSWERNFYPDDAKDPNMADTNFLEI